LSGGRVKGIEQREVRDGPTKEVRELHTGFRLCLSGALARQELLDRIAGITK
jgi:hypothetical protein